MNKRQLVTVDGRELSVSNLDKIYFPETGFTKGEVLKFYTVMADAILPHLRDRPLTLKRYPEGIGGGHFYEKNAPKHTPAWVERCAVPRSEGGSDIHYILCNDLATLTWVTNLGDIEKHVLLAQISDLNRPRSIVFDLDPGEGTGLLDCARVALQLRKNFEALQLQCFVKVSGSKGLHLSVPLNTEVGYEVTQPFAKTMAELVEKEDPAGVVSDMAKVLRKGKVLIDWSQNSDFKTTVSVYAMRARAGGPFISMPVTWEELAAALKRRNEKALIFTPAAAVRRCEKIGDLFAPVLTIEQTLPAAFVDALAAGPAPRLSTWQRHRPGKNQEPGIVRDKSLREYAAKRDHTRTPEPAALPGGKKIGTTPGSVHRFVIQKHEASHLHYDWRLEMEGVLRSWAVPKGPPRVPRETRLAMHVEDHPLEYAAFEGTIPAGNYGAGTVMVWDEGEYEDLTGNPAAAYHQGKMHLVLRGKKLQGEWILLKDRRDEERGNRWLLIKAGKEWNLSAKADDTSAVSGRSMRQIARANDRQWQSNRPAEGAAKSAPQKKVAMAKRIAPKFVEPMQCKAVTELPARGDWSYEIKFDGYRCLAMKVGAEVTLWSRNKKKLNPRFPALVAAIQALPGEFLIDGEVVALNEQGIPSFPLLQNSEAQDPPLFFYAFDLLQRDGEEFITQPIEKRRAALAALVAQPADPLRISALLKAPGPEVLAAVRRLGLEGVVGKRIGSKYEPGERSGAWIKHRTDRRQEFVIGGYVPGNHGFDALLVGVYEKKQFTFVAKVKDGFVPRVRAEIAPGLKPLAIRDCPFGNLPETKSGRWGEALTAEKMKDCRWVKPTLVCEIAFVEWTDAGHLRHCSFVAMRDDKKARQVVREA